MGYRGVIVRLTHIIPAISLSIELFLSKIRIPYHHFIFSLLMVTLYFLWSYVAQILHDDRAILFNSLNWNCVKEFSYFTRFDKSDNTTYIEELAGRPCD